LQQLKTAKANAVKSNQLL